MFGMQELFDEQVRKQCAPDSLGILLLKARLEEVGIVLTKRQASKFRSALKRGGPDSVEIKLSKKQFAKSTFSTEQEVEEFFVGLVDSLLGDIKDFTENLDEAFDDILLNIVSDIAEATTKSLRKTSGKMIKEHAKAQRGFAKALGQFWSEPLGLLQAVIVISDESADAYFLRSDEYSKNDYVCEALTFILAKASQVAKEVHLLLCNGYPDGAQARWRKLHELAVVAMFICEQGDKVAAMYMDHHAVEVYQSALAYNRHCEQSGGSKIPSDKIAELNNHYEQMLKEHGENFRFDYGWTSNVLGKKKPTFRDLEKAVELEYKRLEYREASANIHANPSGVFSSLGLLYDDNLILSGPSSFGLALPGIATVEALEVIIVSLLTHGANIDCLVTCRIIETFCADAIEAFEAVEAESNI
jgi:hypothetical protein